MEAKIHDSKWSLHLRRLASDLSPASPINPSALEQASERLSEINQRIEKIYQLINCNPSELANFHNILMGCFNRFHLIGENKEGSLKIKSACISIIQAFQNIDARLIPHHLGFLGYLSKSAASEQTLLKIDLENLSNRSELCKQTPDWKILHDILKDFSIDIWRYLKVLESRDWDDVEPHFLNILNHFMRLFQRTDSDAILLPSLKIVETILMYTKIPVPMNLLINMTHSKGSEVFWKNILSRLVDYSIEDFQGKWRFILRDWSIIRKILFGLSSATLRGFKVFMEHFFNAYQHQMILKDKQDTLIFFRIVKLLKKIKPDLLTSEILNELDKKIQIKVADNSLQIEIHQFKLLCLESPPFDKLIHGEMREAIAFSQNKGPIELGLISLDDFKLMLNIYFKDRSNKPLFKLSFSSLVQLASLSDYLCIESMKDDLIAKMDTALIEMKTSEGLYDDENFQFILNIVNQLQQLNSLLPLRACMQALNHPIDPQSALYDRIFLDKSNFELFNRKLRETLLQYEISLNAFPQDSLIVQQAVIRPLIQSLLAISTSFSKDHSLKLLQKTTQQLQKYPPFLIHDLDVSRQRIDLKHLEALKGFSTGKLTVLQNQFSLAEMTRLKDRFPDLEVVCKTI